MQLKLKNIGMIKEADVNIGGLTVIAGENDTGKSTVAKVLVSFVHTVGICGYLEVRKKRVWDFCEIFNQRISEIFDNQISLDGEINIFDEEHTFSLYIKNNKCTSSNLPEDEIFEGIDYQVSMVETPVIWNFMSILTQLPLIEDRMKIDLKYPQIMKDLHFQLSISNKKDENYIAQNIYNIIDGEFKQDNLGYYYFEKNNQRIELVNTATGIKYFGILQVLSKNNYLMVGHILILDEPEVHLHPKWQLKMAELIVELVKNGVKVLVNSHSPYMIEALERYSEKADIVSDFYLAEGGFISKIENSNSKTLSKIFSKLSEPFDEFEKMDSEILQGG